MNMGTWQREFTDVLFKSTYFIILLTTFFIYEYLNIFHLWCRGSWNWSMVKPNEIWDFVDKHGNLSLRFQLKLDLDKISIFFKDITQWYSHGLIWKLYAPKIVGSNLHSTSFFWPLLYLREVKKVWDVGKIFGHREWDGLCKFLKYSWVFIFVVEKLGKIIVAKNEK